MEPLYKPKLLDVVIPTCGRARLLYQCLNSLLKNQRVNDFNIIVSHNCRTDRDDIDINVYQQRGLCIYLHQTKDFLPIDESMLSSLDHAHSKYVLWLGDDDQVIQNGIDRVLGLLEVETPEVLVLNMGFTDDVSKSPSPRKTIQEPIVYNNPGQFFKEWVFDLPFGSFVFLNDRQSRESAKRFLGTAHAYSALLFIFLERVFKDQGLVKVLVTTDPVSFSVECEKSWAASRSEILLNLIPQWLAGMREIVGDQAIAARNEYIKRVSRVRYLLELAELGGLPKTRYYMSYLQWWGVMALHLGSYFPSLNRIVDRLFTRYLSLRESLSFR